YKSQLASLQEEATRHSNYEVHWDFLVILLKDAAEASGNNKTAHKRHRKAAFGKSSKSRNQVTTERCTVADCCTGYQPIDVSSNSRITNNFSLLNGRRIFQIVSLTKSSTILK